MKKYLEPQVYIANNHKLAKELSDKYVVSKGNLGKKIKVDYSSGERERLVAFERDVIDNLHEYKIQI